MAKVDWWHVGIRLCEAAAKNLKQHSGSNGEPGLKDGISTYCYVLKQF